MIFWDSSAIVPLLVNEPKTKEAQAILRKDRNLTVWCLTYLEATSALNRRLRTHPLRTADSLQLAAALIAGGNDPSQVNFFSYDDRLNEAAEREGLRVKV
jgi:uncharacterized protein with PIN domain